ncbi:hypothetical protein MYL26_20200 [Escherichia coli]
MNIDIDDERYQKEGTSKAKRVRCLLKQVDRETVCGFFGALWQYTTESMPEQAEQARNDYLCTDFPLENAEHTDEAKALSCPGWHGVEWHSLIAEMKRDEISAATSTWFSVEAWLAELFQYL